MRNNKNNNIVKRIQSGKRTKAACIKKRMCSIACAIMTMGAALSGCTREVLPGNSQNNTMKNYLVTEEMEAVDGKAYDSAFSQTNGCFVPIDGGGCYNTEEYNYIEENGMMNVSLNPISTFAIDVDTASYSNVRRMINQKVTVPEDAVRIEEMINYFHYNYTQSTDDAFSLTAEIAVCPWNPENRLLLLGVKASQAQEATCLVGETLPKEKVSGRNFVFLIDVSGSMMSADKLPLVQQAFSMFVEELDEKDTVSIVTYAGSDTVVIEGVDGSQKDTLLEAINSLEAGGSTYGSKGIETAYAIAEEYATKDNVSRVILATDGDLNVGLTSEGELTRLIQEKRETGIYLTVLGFGTGNLKDNKLEALADNGNGSYGYIDSVFEARKILITEAGGTFIPVANDVKIQVEFNEDMVSGYRLIGYENRLLDTQDFEDDTKDAGEVGSGQTVTVLYEISMAQAVEGEVRIVEPVNMEEMCTVRIRYKEPGETQSSLLEYMVDSRNYDDEMSDNMLLASAVAEFGMVLRGSEYAGTSSCESAIALVSSMEEKDEYVKNFIELLYQYQENEALINLVDEPLYR